MQSSRAPPDARRRGAMPRSSMKSVRVSLPTAIGGGTHIVQPAGRGADAYRAHLATFGPITSPVLESLRVVGLAELNSDAEDLVNRSGRIDGDTASVELPADPLERGLLVWRALSLWSRIAEDLAAIVRAVSRWQEAGRPNHVDCQIGHDYLRWVPRGGADVRDALGAIGDPESVRRLLMLPTRDVAARFVSELEAERIESVCHRTTVDVSAWFAMAADLVTDDTHRTFVRWKHGLTGTSPSKVPLWVTVAGDLAQVEAEEAFGQGFAVIDWEQGKAGAGGPELIAWVATSGDYATYLSAALHGIEMLGTVIDAVLRLVDPQIPVVPWRSFQSPSDDEAAAIDTLGRSGYRLQLQAGLL